MRGCAAKATPWAVARSNVSDARHEVFCRRACRPDAFVSDRRTDKPVVDTSSRFSAIWKKNIGAEGPPTTAELGKPRQAASTRATTER
ncbi:DUF6053 domain-containing protein [Lysobacter gummosus]|uniref:DUF6053 domain-containing protein n=1 Tax=Lysobacter TaxID=68 RepID=UPI003CCD3A0C